MKSIHIDQGWPETNAYRITFTAKGGDFTEADLEAINAYGQSRSGVRLRRAAPPASSERRVAVFDGRRKHMITISRVIGKFPDHGVELFALRALKQRYPGVRFTTYGNSTKQQFGDLVDQIRYTG